MDYATYYQDKLYPLQDKVLQKIKQVVPEFYLTGGTALGRFYDTELKIEFINDVGYHYCDIINEDEYILDNWQNILSNKICALSRNATKDYADILFLSLKYPFNWVDICDASKQKDTWVNEIFLR